jgi:hypothetical protein
MRLFIILFVVAFAAFWGLAELLSGDRTAIRVAETPSQGHLKPMERDPRVPTFRPVRDGRYSSSNPPAEGAKSAQESGDDNFLKGVPENLKREIREAAASLDSDPCDAAARKRLRAALEALIKANPSAQHGPGAIRLVDSSKMDAACAR